MTTSDNQTNQKTVRYPARVVSGIQPSGQLHLGNYHGAIHQWLTDSQADDPDNFFMIADYHALTSEAQLQKTRRQDKLTMALDLLALGVDPTTLFYQSDVPEHAELYVLLGMIMPLQWLNRTPSFKDQQDKRSADWLTHGFLGYPLLMASDILLYRATVVPVGPDQQAHIEITRDIARRFNHLYDKPVFPIPDAKLTRSVVLPGIDGEKMSKSRHNIIAINDTDTGIAEKIGRMKTHRLRLADPGVPDKCPVFTYHTLYNKQATDTKHACETAAIGCVDCKKQCASLVNQHLNTFRSKRNILTPESAQQALAKGAARASHVAQTTLQAVKDAINL